MRKELISGVIKMTINSAVFLRSFQSKNNPESSTETEFNSKQRVQNSQLTMKPILVLMLSMLVLARATKVSPTTTSTAAATKRGLFGSVKAFFSQMDSELSQPLPRKFMICIWKICSRKVIRPQTTTSSTDLKHMEMLSKLQRLYPDQNIPSFKIFDEYVVFA